MKKLFVVLIAIALFANANAQDKKGVIKTNLLSPILGTFVLGYEHVLQEAASVQLAVSMTSLKISGTKFSGFAITPEYRMYLSDSPAPKGWYLAPSLRYSSYNLTVENFVGVDSEASFSAFGGALIIGGQAVLKDIVTFEGFLGPAYSAGSVKVDSGTEDQFSLGAFDGFGLRFGFTIGIAF